jgi:light-regulated signal transduction histidine kinase (bacteriophytochrome)
MSHDLRSPLRAVSGFSEIVYEHYADKLDTRGRDYLVRIIKGSDHMSQLIEALLRLSCISRQDIDRVDYDLSSLATTILNSFCDADPARNVEVVIGKGLRAPVDPNLMEIGLTNLLNNAWKFTSKIENARIEFGATEKGGQTVYFVKDNGVGFDSTYAEKIFLPFHRLHAEKEFEGTGICLAIVERIIRRHEGRIWEDGEIGNGVTIYFTLGRRLSDEAK